MLEMEDFDKVVEARNLVHQQELALDVALSFALFHMEHHFIDNVASHFSVISSIDLHELRWGVPLQARHCIFVCWGEGLQLCVFGVVSNRFAKAHGEHACFGQCRRTVHDPTFVQKIEPQCLRHIDLHVYNIAGV